MKSLISRAQRLPGSARHHCVSQPPPPKRLNRGIMGPRVTWLFIFLASTGCATSDRVSCSGRLEPINQIAVAGQHTRNNAHDDTAGEP